MSVSVPTHHTTSIPAIIAQNPKLSLKAIGLLAIAFANPQNKDIYHHSSGVDFVGQAKGVYRTFGSALNELGAHGYIRQVQKPSKSWSGELLHRKVKDIEIWPIPYGWEAESRQAYAGEVEFEEGSE